MTSSGRTGTPLALRSLLFFALTYLALLGTAGWLVFGSVEDAMTERLLDHLEIAARVSKEGMPSQPAELERWAERMSSASGYRYTIVGADGMVLADSHGDPASMESHAGRPEVASALTGETGRSSRLSETTGFEQLYVAIPASADTVLRLSVSARDLAADSWPYRASIILIVVVVGLVGVAVITWMARRVSAPLTRLAEETLSRAEGEGTQPITTSRVREVDRLGSAISRLDAESRARVEEAGRATETLEVVLGALPQGTVLFDEDDAVVYANPSAYQLLGAVPDKLSGLVPFSFQTAVEECRRSRSPVSIDADHGKPVRVLRAIATPFADDQRVLLVVADVTERERGVAVRRDFVANASHELKTPVAAIIASAEALQLAVERRDRSALRFAGQIETSARHLDRLVADLLDLSRLEREQPQFEPLDLDRLVGEEMERARPIADERDIALVMDSTPVRVAGSGPDLAIAVRNLLDNALRHTLPGGSITATVSVEDDAVLRISDTGEGIPTRDLARVFERFYRVDEARARATGGTGLGLAIVKHVVESHGGSVGAESELGAGSTFTVRLPLPSVQTPTDH